MEKILGRNQTELLDWLTGHWLERGPEVVFVEGFSGTGKSQVARELVQRAKGIGWPALRVLAPESEATAAEDLALDLAQALSERGNDALVAALDADHDLWDALATNLSIRQTLVVVDEVQLMMRNEAGSLPAEITRFLQRIAGRDGRGRLLLLSDRAFHDNLLPSRQSVRHLDPFTDDEALRFLDQRLRDEQIPDAVLETRRHDVIRALGNNLNAIEILSVALRYDDSLDELIGLEPDLWSLDDRNFDPTLLKRLEQKLIALIVSKLEPDTLRVLGRYSVHRKPIKAKAFKKVSAGIPDLIARRDVLVRSFLVDHDKGRDTPNRLVREIVLAGLWEGERRGYHSLAANHYTRHFEARKIEDRGHLGGYFVEACYHLSLSGREADLAPIAAVFQGHLSATLKSTTPVPTDPDERDERIALLLGIYRNKQGPSSIEYHLARCLVQRNHADDWREALRHARRACSGHAPADAWVLFFRLEARKSETMSLQRTIRLGLDVVPVEAGAEKLYASGAKLLEHVGERERAVDLLREDIDRIPADNNLFELYQSAAELLAADGRAREAVELLREGIDRIPADKSLAPLYQSAAELLAADGRAREAIELLREGIDRIPADKNLFSLYQSAGMILSRSGRYSDGIAILQEGMARIPSSKWDREHVVEPALYYCLALGDKERLNGLMATSGVQAIEEQQRVLAEVFRLQIEQHWREAAEIAAAGRLRFPRYLHLTLQESFSWLCAGEPRCAMETFDDFPGRLRREALNSISWLDAFISLQVGDKARARTALATYLDENESLAPQPSQALLLQLWDQDAELHNPVPAYIYPTLPPSLTGLSEPITRTLHGGPILDLQQPKHGDVRIRQRPIHLLALATEWWSRNGGLSTFNRDACKALAAQGQMT